MKDLASSLGKNKKFLIFGCGFSGSFFAKTIKEFGCKVLTSSRSKKNDPNSFVFDDEKQIIPDETIFDGVTHVLSCIPPDKNGKDPVLNFFKDKMQNLSLEWVDIYLQLVFMGIVMVIGFQKKINQTFSRKK